MPAKPRRSAVRRSPNKPLSELELARREILGLRRETKSLRADAAKLERELGRVLHDGICQELSAAAFYLECLQNHINRSQTAKIPKAMEQLSQSLNKAVNSTHALSRRLLSSPVADQEGC